MPDRRDALQFYGAIQPRAYSKLGFALFEVGEYVVDQRGYGTYEVLNANLTLKNPLDRIVTHPMRAMNLGFAFAEFLTELIGDDSLDTMKAFIGSYDKFSSDGEIVDGSYANRLYSYNYEMTQLEQAYSLLKKDPATRRAVVTMYRGKEDLWGEGGLNTPCTLSLQFLLRDDRLHAITTMRSNDYHLGLTYDVFNFTMIQEWLARRLGVELGQYFHNDGSLHIYGSDFAALQAIDMSPMPWTRVMGAMPAAAAKEMTRLADLYCLMAQDAAGGHLDSFHSYVPNAARTAYCKDIMAVGYAYLAKRSNLYHAMNVARMIQDETLRYVTINSFAR